MRVGRGGSGAAGRPLPAHSRASPRGCGLRVGPGQTPWGGRTAGVRAPSRPGMGSVCAEERAPSPGLRVRVSAGGRCPRSLCGGVCVCARGDRARLERPPPPPPPPVTAWGPSVAPPACPRPPRAAHRPAGSALRERRRLRREARPGDGGRRPTTASAAHFAGLGAGIDQWAPGGGVRPGLCGGAGPRPPRSPGLSADTSKKLRWRPLGGRCGGDDPLCGWASAAQSPVFAGAHCPPFHPPQGTQSEKALFLLPSASSEPLSVHLSDPLLPPPGSLP